MLFKGGDFPSKMNAEADPESKVVYVQLVYRSLQLEGVREEGAMILACWFGDLGSCFCCPVGDRGRKQTARWNPCFSK